VQLTDEEEAWARSLSYGVLHGREFRTLARFEKVLSKLEAEASDGLLSNLMTAS